MRGSRPARPFYLRTIKESGHGSGPYVANQLSLNLYKPAVTRLIPRVDRPTTLATTFAAGTFELQQL